MPNKIHVELGKINVFIGASGAGKTRVLQDNADKGDIVSSCVLGKDGTSYTHTLKYLMRNMPVLTIDHYAYCLTPQRALEFTEEFIYDAIDNDTQLLLVTYQQLVLDALDLTDDDIRLFIVDRADDGETKVKRMNSEGVIKVSKEHKDMPLSRLWTFGWLGGMLND